MKDSHGVSSSEGRNTHTYFEVLLAGLTYEKRRTLAPGRLRGDSRDAMQKLIDPNEEPHRGHDAHARRVSQLPMLTVIALGKTER
ncbi:MAG TPA: hypothetical protein VN939_06330 [Chthoniobacterales bacterium]|jgi:hypothetical protein|nr:hypothetical protein [Chthoniobacterales bacterium]